MLDGEFGEDPLLVGIAVGVNVLGGYLYNG